MARPLHPLKEARNALGALLLTPIFGLTGKQVQAVSRIFKNWEAQIHGSCWQVGYWQVGHEGRRFKEYL
jgi:hypothetical protein